MSSTSPAAHGPVLVVAGMHRSGTSCVAGLLHSAGLFVGEHLLGADPTNPSGHFEDLEFLAFHRDVLRAHGLADDGFVTHVRLESIAERYRRRAAGLVEARRALLRPWGWKDPRTVLFLSLWRELVPDARYLFVFRPPWDVVDSLFRRGDPVFVRNPAFALTLWADYNARIRDFARAFPERVLVRELAQVAADPAALCEAVRQELDVPLDPPRFEIRADLLHAAPAERAAFLAAASPGSVALLEELRALSGSTAAAAPPPPAAGPVPRLDEGLEAWQRDPGPRRAAVAPRRRTVFIGVPVYRGEAFVAETLRSILAQEHREFRVCISVDGEDPASVEQCRPFLADPRLELHVQPRRLGWAGNLNWLMSRCREDYFCFWQQDDLASTSFLARLVAHATHYPEAGCVFADVQWFGTRIERVESPSLTGFALERVLWQIEHGSYVPFLGLVRADVLARVGPLRLTPYDSALEDQVWLARLAGQTPWHRVPGTLYFKRGHAQEAHLAWEGTRDDAERRRIWLEWGVGMLEAALTVSPQEHDRLCDIVADRLTVPAAARWFFFDAVGRGVQEMADMKTDFAALVRGRLGVAGTRDRLLAGYAAAARDQGSVEIRTAAGEPGLALLGPGWSHPEAGGVWTDGPTAVLRLPVPAEDGWRVRLDAKPYPHGRAVRGITIRAAEAIVAERTWTSGGDDDDALVEFVLHGRQEVVLDVPWAVAPADLGQGSDTRRLGVCLHGVTLQRAADDAGRVLPRRL